MAAVSEVLPSPGRARYRRNQSRDGARRDRCCPWSGRTAAAPRRHSASRRDAQSSPGSLLASAFGAAAAAGGGAAVGGDAALRTGHPRDERAGCLRGDRLRNRRRDRRPGITRRIAGQHFLAREAVHALAAGVADIEHVGDLRAVLFLGGEDVGPQMEVSALVVAGSHRDALALERRGELLMQLLAERVGRTDDRIQHHLGDRRLGHRLGRRGRLLRGVVRRCQTRATATARKAKGCKP